MFFSVSAMMVYNTAMTEGTETKPRTKVLKNGAIYDLERKRIVSGAALTSADAAQMATRKQERKRERLEAGALAAVRDKFPDKFTGEGDDWIEAIGEQIAYKALDKLDPKQVDAARFLLQETGISEAKQAQPTQEANTADIIAALAQFAGQIMRENGGDNNYYRKHDEDIISVVPTEQDEAAGDVEVGGVDVVGGGG